MVILLLCVEINLVEVILFARLYVDLFEYYVRE